TRRLQPRQLSPPIDISILTTRCKRPIRNSPASPRGFLECCLYSLDFLHLLPSTNTYVRLYSSLQLYTGCPIPWQQKPLQLRLGQKSAGIHRPREHLGRQRNWPCLVGGGSVV